MTESEPWRSQAPLGVGMGNVSSLVRRRRVWGSADCAFTWLQNRFKIVSKIVLKSDRVKSSFLTVLGVDFEAKSVQKWASQTHKIIVQIAFKKHHARDVQNFRNLFRLLRWRILRDAENIVKTEEFWWFLTSYYLSTSSFNHQRKYTTCVTHVMRNRPKKCFQNGFKTSFQAYSICFAFGLPKKLKKLGKNGSQRAPKSFKFRSKSVYFWLGSVRRHPKPILKAFLAGFEASWGGVWAFLGEVWGCLRPSWSVLGRRLGASWRGFGVV